MLQDARHGLLTPQSDVRLGLEGDWVRASTLEGLLPRTPTGCGGQQPPDGGEQGGVAESGRDRSELTRAVAECRLYLHEREAARTNPPVEPRSRPLHSSEQFVERLVSGTGAVVAIASSAVLGILETIFAVMTGGLPNLSTVRRIIGSRLVWGIALSGLIIAVAFVAYNAATKQRRQVATVEQLAAELRTLRNRSADDAAWTAFTGRATETLNRTIPELEESADASDRVSIDLLWAARDFLPQMLKDARFEPSEAERQFDVCMRRIRITHESARHRSANGPNRD